MSAQEVSVGFSGVEAVLEVALALAHGITPSIAVLVIAPQEQFAVETGVLEIGFDDERITLSDCKVDYSAVERNEQGEVWRLAVLDRRWRWRFGRISGSYNVRRAGGTLAAGELDTIDTERTPRELAALLLDAMGEIDYDVEDLPNSTRPSVEWDNTLPAEALAALCDDLACRIVLELDGNVAIRRAGVGADLPAGMLVENAGTLDAPPCPAEVALVCGPTRYQVDFMLEAVGLDAGDAENSDSLAPINELSYKPAAGWSRVDLPYFHQVEARYRGLAQRSVFRYYRIRLPLSLPGYEAGEITTLEQILPIDAEQVELVVESGQIVSRPATVHGVWFPDSGAMSNSTSTLAPAPQPTEGDGGSALLQYYQAAYSIDLDRGLVIFEEPVYRNSHASASGGSGFELMLAPAQLALRASCRVRDDETLAFERHARKRSTGVSGGLGTRRVMRDELALVYVPQYSANYSVAGATSNLASVNAAADAVLDGVLSEYNRAEARMATYAGILPIELDGAIRQVTFRVDKHGVTTTVDRNTQRPGVGYFGHHRAVERSHAAQALVARMAGSRVTSRPQANLPAQRRM